MKDSDERFTCFQLFRSSLIAPEILTYDELYERAKCIVATISGDRHPPDEIKDEEEIVASGPDWSAIVDDRDEIPF
jgi:hypothetical protein